MRRFTASSLAAFCLVVLIGMAPHGRAAHAQQVQRFVVFFQEWSAALDPSAVDAITKAAAFAKDHPTASVRVNGFADPTGSKAANGLMSELRSQVVADQLVADGLPARRVRQAGHGATRFALSAQESRRVEIAIGAP